MCMLKNKVKINHKADVAGFFYKKESTKYMLTKLLFDLKAARS